MITIQDQVFNNLNYPNYRKLTVEEPAINDMCTKRNEALQTVQHIVAGRQISGPKEYLLRQDNLTKTDNQKTVTRYNFTEDD
jgi:hypothetical protein